MRSRVFNCIQYVRHPRTGEVLITEERIKEALAHKTIKRYAYILHDSDVWTRADEEDDAAHRAGDCKPAHYHIVIDTGASAVDVSIIARWLGVPAQYVDVPKGHGAYLDCVQYLTHERQVDKHRYDDVLVTSNHDWRADLDKRDVIRGRFGGIDVDPKYQIFDDVLSRGKTLREVCKEDIRFYFDHREKLIKFRQDYLYYHAPMPALRINYYICGRGGSGKGLVSKALARVLYRDIDDDDQIYFDAGSPAAPLDGYDGQPVIIWDDYRAQDLIKAFGGSGNVYKVFDLHPTKSRQSIKFSTVNLVNTINIINSVQDWPEFLCALAGDEDVYQSVRRFPAIIPVREDDFDFLLNKGFIDRSRNMDYYKWCGIVGNFNKIARALGEPDSIVRRRDIESQTLNVVTDQMSSACITHMSHDDDADMTQYGTVQGTMVVSFDDNRRS